MEELCTTPLFVMPAKAGIQEAIDNTGFPVALRLHGMTKLLVLCGCAKVSLYVSLIALPIVTPS